MAGGASGVSRQTGQLPALPIGRLEAVERLAIDLSISSLRH